MSVIWSVLHTTVWGRICFQCFQWLFFNDSNVKKSLNYLSKFNNFILIVINNEKTDINEKESVILRYYGIGAQIIKDLKIKNMISK